MKDVEKIKKILSEEMGDEGVKAVQHGQRRSKTDIAIELLENFLEIFGEDDELVTKILEKVTVDDIAEEISRYSPRLSEFFKTWLRYRLSKCGQYGGQAQTGQASP